MSVVLYDANNQPVVRTSSGYQQLPTTDIATLRAATSILLSRREMAIAGGLTFDGARDLSTALGYKPMVTPQDYRIRYNRGGLAARVVDVKPESTWVDGVELIEDESDLTKLTAFEQAFEELNARLNIWSVFQRADILAGIGRYAIILIGAPGQLEAPLNRATADQIAYLMPYAEDDAKIDPSDIEDRWDSARFGRPNFYRLRRASLKDNVERKVHWTRVTHILDGALDDPIFGPPRMERVWNKLDDLDKVTGGGAEAFWLRAHQGYHLDIDKDVKIPSGAAGTKVLQDLEDETDEFVHGMRRFVRTQGAKVKTLGSDVADFKNPTDSIVEQIAGSLGIPKRILMGSERGELASTQDKTSWEERMRDRRVRYAFPMIIKPFVDRLIEIGALPKPKQYKAIWPNANNLTDGERMEMAERASKVNFNMGEEVFTVGDIRDRIMGWPALEPTGDTNDGDTNEPPARPEPAEPPVVEEPPVPRAAEAATLPAITVNVPPANIVVNVPATKDGGARKVIYDGEGRIIGFEPVAAVTT